MRGITIAQTLGIVERAGQSIREARGLGGAAVLQHGSRRDVLDRADRYGQPALSPRRWVDSVMRRRCRSGHGVFARSQSGIIVFAEGIRSTVARAGARRDQGISRKGIAVRRVAIIGSGNMGSWHASRWRALPVKLAGFYDADPARAAALAAQYGGQPFTSLEAALESSDLIDICTHRPSTLALPSPPRAPTSM